MKKIMIFAGIFIVLIFAYIAFHAVVYFSIVHFFAISDAAAKKIFLAGLIFLGLSFFAATFLSHWRDDVFTRAYYFFSGSWIGFLINLVVFFVLAWIISGLLSWLEIPLGKNMLGIIVICAAAAYSIYGIWNAFTPTIKHLNVQIDNLPDEWKGKKIVQISDVHLGHIYTADYMQSVVQKINSLKPDIIFITGDLFDGTDGNLDVFTKPLSDLKAPDGIYYSLGNHETYLGVDKTQAIIDKTNIKLLRDQMVILGGLQIIGIDYSENIFSKNIAEIIKNLPNFDSNKPSILLWHAPTQINAVKDAGISLQLSGHAHKGQLFPLGFITSLVYKGYDYGYIKEGSYSIYASSGLGGWGPPMRTEKTSEIVEITLK